jgi:hypothetical protein
VFHLRDKEFWNFQRDALQRIGHRWRPSKLVYKVVGALIKSPLFCLRTFGRSLKSRRIDRLPNSFFS